MTKALTLILISFFTAPTGYSDCNILLTKVPEISAEIRRRQHRLETVFEATDAQAIVDAAEQFLREVDYSRDVPFVGGIGKPGDRRSTLWGMRTPGLDRVKDPPREIELQTDRLDASLIEYVRQNQKKHSHFPAWEEIARFLDSPERFILRMVDLQIELKSEQNERERQFHEENGAAISFHRKVYFPGRRSTAVEIRAGLSQELFTIGSRGENGGSFRASNIRRTIFPRKMPIVDGALRNTPHGLNTHRIQWMIIFLEFEANPNLFTDTNGNQVRFEDLYQALGEVGLVTVERKLDNTETLYEVSDHPIWDALVDTFYHSPSSPVFIKLYNQYWPGIDPTSL